MAEAEAREAKRRQSEGLRSSLGRRLAAALSRRRSSWRQPAPANGGKQQDGSKSLD